ncbi:uncharacterized protein SOCE26_089760 [Sorangium cellulosum]|uniref:DUF2085 domain-containing protein n=1 Tax=Sorangium cellulosum TaxID=56 RepID=A0A2L0F7B2_SORCE|nr:DUF2085 domain-containing protein [Sorangium cellulosum]AUX47455.1 uncharacterized protein SOCE26_089760 [Sorangium cellulosum]
MVACPSGRGRLAGEPAAAADRASDAARGGSRQTGASLRWAARGALALLGALPWCIPLARSRLPLGELGAALDLVFAPMCHRMPGRSIALEGVMMPLCSRCAGIFAGVAVGAAIARPRLPMAAWRPILVAAGALMAVDAATQDLGLHPVWHPTRLATGVAFGYAVAAAFLAQLARRPG